MDQRSDVPARHDDTRRAILNAARGLFMAQGFRAVSTRQVADACGLTQPALYYHFGGKQDLYVAVLLDQLDDYRAALTEIAEAEATGKDRLTRAIHVLIQRSELDHAQMFHDIRWEISSDRQAEIRASFQRSMLAPLHRILAATRAEGLIADERTLALPLDGLVMHLMNIIRYAVESMGFSRARGEPTRSVSMWVATVERLFFDGVGSRR